MPPCRWWQVRSAGGRLGAGPVRRDREVVGHVEPLVDPPGGVLGGEVEGARGDVDVGDLHRDRLELGQRPAELGAALDVGRGEVAGAGDHAGRGQAEPGDVALGAAPARRRRRSSSAAAPSRTTVCVGDPGAEPDSSRVTPGSLDVDQRHDRLVAVHRRDQQPGRSVGVGDGDLAAGDRAVGVRRVGAAVIARPASRSAGVRSSVPAGDARQQRLLLLLGAGRGERQGAAAERLPDRQVLRAGAGLAEQHAHLGQAEPLAAVGLGHGEPEQPGLGRARPSRRRGRGRLASTERTAASDSARSGSTCVNAVSRHVQNCNVFYRTGGPCVPPTHAVCVGPGLPAVRADPPGPDGRAAGPRVDVRHRHAGSRPPSRRRSCCCTRWAAPGC